MAKRFFDWLRPENRRPFYVIVATLVFCCMTILALSMGVFPLSEKEQTGIIRVIGFGGGFLTLLYVIVRGEQFNSYQHKATHDLKDGQQAAVSAAQVAIKVAEQAPQKTAELAAELTVKKINGGLDKAAKKALDESPFPTTREELTAFVRSVKVVDCDELIGRVLDRAMERGWKAPKP